MPLGTSGALTIFEPLEPLLLARLVRLLLLAIWIRWRPVAQPVRRSAGQSVS